MARAIKHIHDKNFVHLDVKPSNFFVSADKTCKLGDYGIAIDLETIRNEDDNDQCGDSIYMAPELLKTYLPLHERMT